MNKKDATAPASETGSGREFELPNAPGPWTRRPAGPRGVVWILVWRDPEYGLCLNQINEDGTLSKNELGVDQLIKGGWQPAVAGGEGEKAELALLQGELERKSARISELRKQGDDLIECCNRHQWRWNQEQGTWLATRDANQALTAQVAGLTKRAEASAAALAEARGEIERLKHRLTSYEAIETRAEQLLDPTFRWQHCEALFDLVDEFGKLRERLAAVEAAGKLAMEAMQDNLSAYCYKNEPALLSAYRAMEAALTTAATRPSPRCKPMPNDVTELKARVRELEQALRDLIAACKTSGRIVGYNSDAVDRAEAVLRAKGE